MVYDQNHNITKKGLKMISKKLSKLIVLGTVTAGSFLAGTYYEKTRYESFCIPKKCYNLPALPIFGTVSAATAVAPASVDTNVSNKISQIMKYGFPGLDNVKSFDDFILSYDRRNRVAHWVFEHLTAENVKRNDAVDRSKCEFKPDESIHKFFRSENSDYKGSGYDRGHLAAAGNHKSHQKCIEQTFFLSNMAPQVGVGFNRDAWNRKEANGKNYVKYEVIGANHVAVPTHFYKVVVGETTDGKLEMESYVMPNQVIDNNVPLTSFQVPPDSIERAAGLLFFNNVSRNKISKINGKNNS